MRFGDVIGGLLNATFGNVVELILSIAALTKCLYTVVAMSLIGSILSNMLLVLGEASKPQSFAFRYCNSAKMLVHTPADERAVDPNAIVSQRFGSHKIYMIRQLRAEGAASKILCLHESQIFLAHRRNPHC